MAVGVSTASELLSSFVHTLSGGDPARLAERRPDLGVDAVVCGVYTVGLFALNWAVRAAVVLPIASWALAPAPSSPLARKGAAAAKKRAQAADKFAQSAMELVFYGAFFAFGAVIVPSQPWFWPSSEWWSYDRPTAKIRDDVRCYYILYCARYVQAIVSVLLEHRRKDFAEMMTHHVVTVILTSVSYAANYFRCGAVIMVLLDPADVPLHAAKLHKYVADAKQGTKLGQRCQWCADRWFELFAVSFFITRCCMFAYCCWSAHIESARHAEQGTDLKICIVLCYILLLLQYMWMYMIIAAAIRMMRTGTAEDVRSDDEGEDAASPKGPTSFCSNMTDSFAQRKKVANVSLDSKKKQ